MTQRTLDPYGELFMGFEGKSRPVLQAIMDHHGLSLCTPSQKLTAEEMRRRIMSHIMLGECYSRNPVMVAVPSSQLQCPALRQNIEGEEFTCKDFVHVAERRIIVRIFDMINNVEASNMTTSGDMIANKKVTR